MAVFKLKKYSMQLHQYSSLDNLTHLPNRRSFNYLINEYAKEITKNNKNIGLLFIDLDNFKAINNNLGHDAGDLLLKHVALRLTESVRTSDVVFRIGGDEFTVLLPGLENEQQGLIVANRIINNLNKAFILNVVEVNTKGSIGLALMPTHALNTADLIKYADTAMYYAKEKGKGCVVVYNCQ